MRIWLKEKSIGKYVYRVLLRIFDAIKTHKKNALQLNIYRFFEGGAHLPRLRQTPVSSLVKINQWLLFL